MISYTKSKPLAIKKNKQKNKSILIETSRSYDEQQHIPSFVRMTDTPLDNHTTKQTVINIQISQSYDEKTSQPYDEKISQSYDEKTSRSDEKTSRSDEKTSQSGEKTSRSYDEKISWSYDKLVPSFKRAVSVNHLDNPPMKQTVARPSSLVR